jgi:coenzyme F420-0:L-glutamate ligase/coenzyme F420-1:gamma-L-glutamate ligase
VSDLSFRAVPGLPLVTEGDDLADGIATALEEAGLQPRDADVLVVAQKIISKAEGRQVDLRGIEPSPAARALADQTSKDPRLVEVMLQQSSEVVRCREGLIIVSTHQGLVMANAGIDASNVTEGEHDRVLLLPEDPDRSAADLRAALSGRFGVDLGVIICDSIGRAFRMGTIGTAIGVAGITALDDRRGDRDLFGRELRVTEVAVADSVAAGAALVMGEGTEGRPVVLVRGLDYRSATGSAADLIRPREQDLFR